MVCMEGRRLKGRRVRDFLINLTLGRAVQVLLESSQLLSTTNSIETGQESPSGLWTRHVQLFDDVINQHEKYHGVFVDGGCGKEQFLQRYSSNFKYCIGFDIEHDGKQCNSKNVMYSYGDLEYIPLRGSSVDVFLTNFVLEHIKHPERFFEEIGRVIKPNGVFVLWTPNAHSPSGALIKMLPVCVTRTLKHLFFKDKDYYPTYYRANTVSELNRMLKKAGFTRVYIKMIDGIFYFSRSRVVGRLHNIFVRLSNHGRLRYCKDIIFAVYIKHDMGLHQNGNGGKAT